MQNQERRMPSTDFPLPRAALITGGARRLGRAMAEALAADGWAVAIHCRASEAEATDAAAAIERAGGRALVLPADLGAEAEVETLIPRAQAALGPIGCLINNASVFDRDDATDATRASWDAHLEPNLRAPFVLSQAFARALPETAKGVIVNMLDQRVWNLTPYFVSYTVSKSALWTLTRTLALALAPRIRVNGIGPGPALPSARQTAAEFDRQCAALPLRHGTTPEEIVLALRFILAAPSMTGQMIALDGGQHLGWAQERAAAPPHE
jgi:NAD(P)-dependent dehydrogenase (short-subunit alcohol dehydrogenase family)